jgi:hypothetical protein
LDGLRCASIIAVIWEHTRPDRYPSNGRDTLAWLPGASRGFLGVDLFFVISGFLIVTLLVRERTTTGTISLRNFYGRRILRIFPRFRGSEISRFLAELTDAQTGTESVPARPVTSRPNRASVRSTSVLCVLVYCLTGCGLIIRQATIAYIGVNSHFSPKEIEIQIHRSFIEEYKNRVGIHTTFTVDRAMASPLPGAIDGDLHFAGRAKQVALPIVAEIVNAADQKAAIDVVHGAAGTGRRLNVSGVWRIWPEHAGKAEEEQGKELPAFDTDNPDHVFEIHPVTRINGVQLLDSFTPVKGFSPGGAQRTFAIYEKVSCTLRAKADTVSIVTETGLYNDVEFIMQIADEPQLVVADGRFVIAAAMDLDGNLLVPRLRMVFAKGTPPERAVRLLKGGDRLHAYGIPRLDFAEISRRVRDSQTNPALLTQRLPYEILVLGVYPK